MSLPTGSRRRGKSKNNVFRGSGFCRSAAHLSPSAARSHPQFAMTRHECALQIRQLNAPPSIRYSLAWQPRGPRYATSPRRASASVQNHVPLARVPTRNKLLEPRTMPFTTPCSFLLVGASTYGKGVVQRVVRLSSELSVRLTTARWLTPTGRTLERRQGTGSSATGGGQRLERLLLLS